MPAMPLLLSLYVPLLGCNKVGDPPPDPQDDTGELATAVISPLDGLAVDPTDPDATWATIVLVTDAGGAGVPGLQASIGGAALAVEEGSSDTAALVRLSGLPVQAGTVLELSADGFVPRRVRLSFGESVGATQIPMTLAQLSTTFDPAQELVADVGNATVVIPPGALASAASQVTVSGAELDLVELLASASEDSAVSDINAHLPSSSALVRGRADFEFAPGVVSRVDLVATDAGGAVALGAGQEIEYDLAIPARVSMAFHSGRTYGLYAHDPAANRYEQVGECVVEGDRCTGSAASLEVSLLMPQDRQHFGTGCVRARVTLSGPADAALAQRSLEVQAHSIPGMGSLPPETRYAVDGDALVLTALFPFVSRDPLVDTATYSIASTGSYDDGRAQTTASGPHVALVLFDGHKDLWASCEAMPPLDISLAHSPVTETMPEADFTTSAVEALDLPEMVCTDGTLVLAAQAGGNELISAGESATLTLSGEDLTVTPGAGGATVYLEDLELPAGMTLDTVYDQSIPVDVPSRYFLLYAMDDGSGVTDASFTLDFGGPATDHGADQRYVVVLNRRNDLRRQDLQFSHPLKVLGRAVVDPGIESNQLHAADKVAFLPSPQSSESAPLVFYTLPEDATSLDMRLLSDDITDELWVVAMLGLTNEVECELSP